MFEAEKRTREANSCSIFPLPSRGQGDIETNVRFDDILGDGESILVVDDSEEQARTGGEHAERLGYQVEQPGEAAINASKTRKSI